MNCPKCNCELPSGVLFCNECGFKTGNISLCTECGTSLKDGVLFCPVCRTPSRDKYNNQVKSEHEARNNSELSGYNSAFDSDESIERTMTIPVIKSNTHRPSESGEGPSAERAGARPKANSMEGITPKKSVNPNKRRVPAKRSGNGLSIVQKNVLIFIVVFISVVFTGVMGIVAVMKSTYDTPPLKKTELVVKKTSSRAESEKGKSEPEEEIPKTEAGHSKQIDVYVPKVGIDLVYEFQKGIALQDVVCANKVNNLKIHENREFLFSCSVPESFVANDDGSVEVRYLAQDKTAYLDIGAFKNDKKWSRDSVRDAIIGNLGGSVDYQSNGDGWFIVNVIKDGIYYYQKCMVNDESIRYFEFAYPEEYSDIYSEYVSNIDSGFREIK